MRCTHLTALGEPCSRPPYPGTTLCDPHFIEITEGPAQAPPDLPNGDPARVPTGERGPNPARSTRVEDLGLSLADELDPETLALGLEGLQQIADETGVDLLALLRDISTANGSAPGPQFIPAAPEPSPTPQAEHQEPGICGAPTRSGLPCRATPRRSSGLCINHDPAYRDQQRQNARKAGLASAAARAPIIDPDDLWIPPLLDRTRIQALLGSLFRMVLLGRISENRALGLIRILNLAARNFGPSTATSRGHDVDDYQFYAMNIRLNPHDPPSPWSPDEP
jgi:hypothetical protein